MSLVALSINPIPSGAVVGQLRTPDGLSLRFARWDATRPPIRGTVCLFPGRGEFIEKYFEVVADLRRRGFVVAVLDWRGQGGSERRLADRRKGHVGNYSEYDRDLRAFMTGIVLPECPPPYIALAHSMGGQILLRNAVLADSWFERMVLIAPMIALADRKVGYSQPIVRAIIRLGSAFGQGRRYVPGGSGVSAEEVPFARNELTSDAERFNRNAAVLEAAPGLGIGSPTVGWLAASFNSMSRVAEPDYPLRVQRPLLLFAAGNDAIVSTLAIENFALRLKVGTHVLVPNARHEILQETDDVRARFWAAFDAYLGLDRAAA